MLFWSWLVVALWIAPMQDPSEPTSAIAWPQWRGPLGTGEAPGADPPIRWSEQENVRWKTPLPGLGHSTPVVVGSRLFLTAAVPIGEMLPARPETAPGAHDNLPVTRRHRFLVLAVDRDTGRIAWQRTVHEALPYEGGHVSGSLASASPVTDGKRVFASFGSYGLYALDLEGELIWQRDLGRLHSKHAHGEGSSPALFDGTLVVNADHEEQSFLVALDAATGETRWRVERDEVTSWASPIVVTVDGRAQVIVAGTQRVRAYDLEDGRVIWECGGLSHNVVATPVAGDGLVFVGSSYEKRALLAIRLAGARGDITGSKHVVWSRRHRTPYVPSPLLYGGALYFLSHYQGILTRVDAPTGAEQPGPMRLPGVTDFYASPLAAAGRLYFVDRDGSTLVLTDDAPPQRLALNRLDDQFSASPVAIDRELLLRGERFLYCLAEKR